MDRQFKHMFTNNDTANYQLPENLPDKVDFHNLLIPEHDYFQYDVDCELKNANEIVFPPNTSFYLSNDAKEHMLYRINVNENGLTRQDLAYHILNWLNGRNIYFNIDILRRKKRDILWYKINNGTHNLSIHSIGKEYMISGIPLYTMCMSS